MISFKKFLTEIQDPNVKKARMARKEQRNLRNLNIRLQDAKTRGKDYLGVPLQRLKKTAAAALHGVGKYSPKETPLKRVMSGTYLSDDWTSSDFGTKKRETSYYAKINAPQSGTGHLWMSHVEGPDNTHELHFSISDFVDLKKFKRTRNRLRMQGNPDHAVGHKVFYSIPGQESFQMTGIKRHGLGTMKTIAKHASSIVERIPSGGKIILDPQGSSEAAKKAKIYSLLSKQFSGVEDISTTEDRIGNRVVLRRI